MHVWNNVGWSIWFITWGVGNMLPSSTTKHYRPFGWSTPHRWTCGYGRTNEQCINCDDRSSYKRCSQYFDVGGISRWSSCMGDILEVQYDFNAPMKPHDV